MVQALTTIEVRGPDGERLDGQTLYRDARAPSERFDGPLRQVCELLDYRYARHVGTPGYLLQPLIDQGWGRSVQFWVSPAAVVGALDGSGGGPAIVVVKVFPFMSLLWIGLLLLLFGSTWLALSGARGVRRARRGVARRVDAPAAGGARRTTHQLSVLQQADTILLSVHSESRACK
ncbi:hypothetical protein [Thauera humireducens]|uniref:hypothetical protein n=1 Tax=Thauera humireducens TaxID=1134435 RepID=UPI00311DC4DA